MATLRLHLGGHGAVACGVVLECNELIVDVHAGTDGRGRTARIIIT